jgi:hypothetical protein
MVTVMKDFNAVFSTVSKPHNRENLLITRRLNENTANGKANSDFTDLWQ